MKKNGWKNFGLGVLVGMLGMIVFVSGALVDRISPLPGIDRLIGQEVRQQQGGVVEERVVNEESAVIEVADKVSPAVVTVSIKTLRRGGGRFLIDPFGMFSLPLEDRTRVVEQDIGSGFIVDSNGLIVTNKHVVSDASEETKYKVVLKDGQEYEVTKIWRDPLNDLAILKIEPDKSLPKVELGDSDKLKVGQMAVAIGTALGEFRHTVTVGVISGLGRGIVAGDAFSGQAERLDNVIQTDAAINPGNSGGPLLNSAGQVIGVNVAVSQQGQNIGFAIPINVVKESLTNFKETGEFNRVMLGVRYKMINKEVALINDVPAGAYVVEVVTDSNADRGGIKQGDIIVEFDGKRVSEEKNGLAGLMAKKKTGEVVKLKLWREGKLIDLKLKLEVRNEK